MHKKIRDLSNIAGVFRVYSVSSTVKTKQKPFRYLNSGNTF